MQTTQTETWSMEHRRCLLSGENQHHHRGDGREPCREEEGGEAAIEDHCKLPALCQGNQTTATFKGTKWGSVGHVGTKDEECCWVIVVLTSLFVKLVVVLLLMLLECCVQYWGTKASRKYKIKQNIMTDWRWLTKSQNKEKKNDEMGSHALGEGPTVIGYSG